MKAERNQRIVEVFFESLDRGDAEALLAAYAPDATVWTAGSLPFSGTHTMDQLPEKGSEPAVQTVASGA